MNKIKLIEVKECEPERIDKVMLLCDHCGQVSFSNVRVVNSSINMDEIISRVNDELDTAKVRIERIIRSIEE